MHTQPFSHKKVIMPISPEADILAASATGRRRTLNVTTTSQPALHSSTTTHTSKASAEATTRALASVNKHTPLTPGSEARINSEIELELLLSGLDRKNRRLKEILAFLAQVLFWAAATYVIIL